MEANSGVAERIERRLDALGLRPEEVDAKVGLPPGTTERLGAGHGPVPGGRFLRGLCAALDTDEAYLLGLEPGDLVPAELLVEPHSCRNLPLTSDAHAASSKPTYDGMRVALPTFVTVRTACSAPGTWHGKRAWKGRSRRWPRLTSRRWAARERRCHETLLLTRLGRS
jgi:hypothetical protein